MGIMCAVNGRMVIVDDWVFFHSLVVPLAKKTGGTQPNPSCFFFFECEGIHHCREWGACGDWLLTGFSCIH